MSNIQIKLKNLMKEQNVGTHILAKKANVPESSIKNIIYGKSSKPRYELVVALSKELGCSLADLLSDDDPRISDNLEIYQSDEKWDIELHHKALMVVMQNCRDHDLVLTKEQAQHYINHIYNYAVLNNESSIDHKFANYVMREHLSGDK